MVLDKIHSQVKQVHIFKPLHLDSAELTFCMGSHHGGLGLKYWFNLRKCCLYKGNSNCFEFDYYFEIHMYLGTTWLLQNKSYFHALCTQSIVSTKTFKW